MQAGRNGGYGTSTIQKAQREKIKPECSKLSKEYVHDEYGRRLIYTNQRPYGDIANVEILLAYGEPKNQHYQYDTPAIQK
jgi:hypothetical protein